MPDRHERLCLQCPNRRSVLRSTGVGVAIAVLGAACGSETSSEPTGPLRAGNLSATAVGDLRVMGGNVVLGRDARGLYAMSAICTHQGCTVMVTGAAGQQSLVCPCHSSQFSGNGTVTRGPAQSPLQHYQVDLAADGSITVQGGQPVSGDVRTPVA